MVSVTLGGKAKIYDFDVTDIKIIPGIASYSPNFSFINLVIHDQTRHGIYVSESATDNLVYGCVIYNNGWRSPDSRGRRMGFG